MNNPPEEILVDIITHEKTGLLVAMSNNLKGLYAHGRTMSELEANLEVAISDIIEATYRQHVEVTVSDRPSGTKGFKVNAMKFNTSVAA
ncbi:MAG: hypothetical protein WA782_19540 [Sulfitobacter sp.]